MSSISVVELANLRRGCSLRSIASLGLTARWSSCTWRSAPFPRVLSYKPICRVWALRPGSVDAVASFYALGHVPSDRHGSLFTAIGSWLRPGGLLLTSAPLVAGDSTQADWLGVPMFFGGISEDDTRRAVSAAGLQVERWEVVDEDEGDGEVVSFLWFVARQPTGL